ncbi:hypothetical protein OSTOST_23462 [Ostertagia ostertagi]
MSIFSGYCLQCSSEHSDRNHSDVGSIHSDTIVEWWSIDDGHQKTHGDLMIPYFHRNLQGVSLIGVALCLFLVPCTSSFTPALLIFTMAMACRGLHHGGVSVNPHDFAPHHTGAVFGIFNACGAITGFIGVYVAGHILDATNNNWSYVFIITGVQCVIGAIVYGRYGTGTKII